MANNQKKVNKHDKDQLKATLCHCNIDTTTWEILASDRCLLCNTICSSITSMKAIQMETAERQCKEHKSQISQVDSADASLTRHECGKACTVKIYFINHMQTHRRDTSHCRFDGLLNKHIKDFIASIFKIVISTFVSKY